MKHRKLTIALLLISLVTINHAQPPSAQDDSLIFSSTDWNPDLSAKADKRFKISKDKEEAYKSFLGQKGAGIFQFVVPDRENFARLSAEEKGVAVEGLYYSFVKNSHYSRLSDLQLMGNQFTPAPLAECMGDIKSLGDVPLEKVSLETPEVAKLLEMPLPENYKYLVEVSGKGRNSAEAVLKHTYVLRSVIYQRGIRFRARFQPWILPDIEGFADTTVAFRLVEQNPDGSRVILWKLLRKKTPPGLK
jgi:hypothetical protein